MYPWPLCIECKKPMPYLGGSSTVDVHTCSSCEKIVLVDGKKLTWYTGIYTPKEILKHFPDLLTRKEVRIGERK